MISGTVFLLIYAGVIAGVGAGIYAAWRTGQFDEDIKYLVFTESDKDKMTPEAFKRSQEVLAEQIAKRDSTRGAPTK